MYSKSQYPACPPLFVITFRSRWGMKCDKSCDVESGIFFQACLSRLFRSFIVLGVGSLQTTSSIMLQRFSTGLISGEFGGQHVFSIKFGRFFLHHAWVALAACAACLGQMSSGDWSWTIFARLLLHSHFYGEGQASLLSLICCWCSNWQSKSVLGVKNVSQCDCGLSFRPIWSTLNFF